MATPSDRTLKLAAIGTLAGLFSGIFGVGGGTVIVPLLIFWFGYGERLATGTSLAAIVLIGLLGAIAQGGLYGNVHLLTGLLLDDPRRARRRRRHRDPAAHLPARRVAALRRPAGRRRDRADRPVNELAAILIALAGGLAGGLVGVGGGVLFVPALTIFLGLSQVEGESTSLLMIVIVALVGAYRQNAYGNVKVRDALVIGAALPARRPDRRRRLQRGPNPRPRTLLRRPRPLLRLHPPPPRPRPNPLEAYGIGQRI